MSELHILALIGKINRLIRRFLEAGLESKDLTFNQYNLLQLIASRTQIRPSEAAEALGCNRPTATVIVNNLEKKGWVHRRTDPGNRRQVIVRLTEEGAAKAEETRQWVIAVKGSFDPLVGLSEAEIAQLRDLLERIGQTVEDHLDGLAERLAHEP